MLTRKLFFQIVRMVWLLDDHLDKQHRSYASMEQRVVMKVAGVMNFVCLFKHKCPIYNVMICLFVGACTSEASVSRGHPWVDAL